MLTNLHLTGEAVCIAYDGLGLLRYSYLDFSLVVVEMMMIDVQHQEHPVVGYVQKAKHAGIPVLREN